jgi:hypothetical protein
MGWTIGFGVCEPLQGQGIFVFTKTVQIGCGVNPASCSVDAGGFSQG